MPQNTKSLGKVKIEEVSVVKYPSQDDMILVSFEQNDSTFGQVHKEQYWKKVGTRWQIVQEQSTKL